MKVLIVEDDFTSRNILQRYLAPYGDCDIAVDGKEAMSVFESAHKNGEPYELVCLDIMMPEMDGHQVLKGIRSFEDEKGIALNEGAKVVMTTALDDSSNVLGAFKEGCEAYIVKPIDRNKLFTEIRKLGLLPEED